MKIKNQKSPPQRLADPPRILAEKIKITYQNPKILNSTLSFYILIFAFCILSVGCEAFVRKFTRKPKKENLPREEMVLVPQEYQGLQIPKEELYRQYFLFWKSWQDELINSLSAQANQKKQIGSAAEAIKNLMNLRALLNAPRQKQLDIYVGQLNDLKGLITQDAYGLSIANHRQKAERIKRNILREFPYKKVKDYLL